MQTLQEIRGAATHSGVNVRLGRFDVVVEVIAEGLDVADNVLSSLPCKVSGKQNYLWSTIVSDFVLFVSDSDDRGMCLCA